MPTSPSPEQVEEWLLSDVTRYFRALLDERLNDLFRQRGEVFYPFEAHKTQESKALLLGGEVVIQEILDAFEEKDLQQLEIVDEERVRHSSLRRPSADPPG